MTVKDFKGPSLLLSLLCLAVLLVSTKLAWDYGKRRLQNAWADEQVEVFDSMRKKALEEGVTNATECLQYLVNYYPSGTKQQIGSKLDAWVERERADAIGQIIRHLRTVADKDLGEDPQSWIRVYAGNR